MNEKQLLEYEQKRIFRSRMLNIILIASMIFIVLLISFSYFVLTTNARNRLREGKNVLLALEMLSIESYGRNSSVYDPTKRNGLAEGVKERLEEISGENGETFITSYNSSRREVTGFTYERDSYRITYKKDSTGAIKWTIDYILPIMHYQVSEE